METIYRKVAVSERLPNDDEFTVLTDKGKLFVFDVKNTADWWLEEIDLTQLQKDKENLTKLKSTIEDFRDRAKKSSEDLNGAGLEQSAFCSQAMEFAYKNCLIEIESLIQKHKA